MHSPYGHQTTTDDFAVQASTTQTASTNGAAVDCPGGTLRLTLNVSAVSGTTPCRTVATETRKDASDTYRSVGSFAAKTAAGSERKCFPGLDRQVRAVTSISGTTPSFTFSVIGEVV